MVVRTVARIVPNGNAFEASANRTLIRIRSRAACCQVAVQAFVSARSVGHRSGPRQVRLTDASLWQGRSRND